MNAPSPIDSAPHAAPQSAAEIELEELLAAGQRVLVLVSPDEARALACLARASEALGLELQRMSLSSGAVGLADASDELARSLRAPASQSDNTLTAACEMYTHLDPAQRRAVREHAQRARGQVLAFIEPTRPQLPPEVPCVVLPPPGAQELELAYAAWVHSAAARLDGPDDAAVSNLSEHARDLAREGLGLELFALRAALHLALARTNTAHEPAQLPTPALVRAAIRDQKNAQFSGDSVLERVEAIPARELGGLGSFKAWLQRRALALQPEAGAAGIPLPRGVMLVGVQGCGKSLAARCCADVLGLPLFRLDPGRLFEGVVGASEARLAHTLAAIEGMAPVVLWLDEIDKGLAGADSGASDGGTTARVVGALLTWLQERERPVFVIATANDPTRLPAELQRRGRLDELFFVDLPNAETRARILEIHLQLRPARELGSAPPLSDSPDAYFDLARQAEGFSGAELQACVVEARLDAFARGEPLSPEDLRRALAATVPLSRARKESVDRLRQWAQDRARLA